ncbi:MAG: hypothetical protein AAFV88_12370 [Planctomycetota bacterium]
MLHALRAKMAIRERRMSLDLVLIFAAVFTITLVTWPRQDARQVVRLQQEDDTWATRSLAVSDPQLTELRQKVRRWESPESDPDYATAKWRKETAEHYLAISKEERSQTEESHSTSEIAQANQEPASPSDIMAPIARLSDDVELVHFDAANDKSSSVSTASFQDSSQTSRKVQASQTSQATSYWRSVVDSANRRISVLEARAEEIPVDIGQTRATGWPPISLHAGLLAGLLACCGYMHWNRLAPWRPQAGSGGQSVATLARIGTYAGVVCWSLLCCMLAFLQG